MKRIISIALSILTMLTILIVIPATSQAAVSLNVTSKTMYVGATCTLKLTGTTKTPTWSSSQKTIATVTSKGKVTAKSKGTVTISAKIGTKSYKCKITVKNPYINKTKLTLNEKSTYNLKIYGSTAKSWSSNNSKVAIVNSKGVVTAKSKGIATITCKATNGKSYKCSVTVNPLKRTTDLSDLDAFLRKKGVVYGTKYEPMASLIGAKRGYAYDDKSIGFEIYEYDTSSQIYKDIVAGKPNDASNWMGTKAHINGKYVLWFYEKDKQNVLSAFNSFVA